MWELYDELIELVPENSKIGDCLAGAHWNLVRTSHVGMAMTSREGCESSGYVGKVRGMMARDAAALVKSWNPQEAALGLATINSAVNEPERLLATPGFVEGDSGRLNVFECMRAELQGKRVAVVGHFRGLECLARECKLTILERIPQRGDLPDTACEYVLPDQDYVFITGTTLINKTLPRLLEVSKGAVVAVVGPSTPMTEVLFRYGVDVLAGTAVLDEERVWSLVQEGDQHGFFDSGGRMMKIVGPRRREGSHHLG